MNGFWEIIRQKRAIDPLNQGIDFVITNLTFFQVKDWSQSGITQHHGMRQVKKKTINMEKKPKKQSTMASYPY